MGDCSSSNNEGNSYRPGADSSFLFGPEPDMMDRCGPENGLVIPLAKADFREERREMSGHLRAFLVKLLCVPGAPWSLFLLVSPAYPKFLETSGKAPRREAQCAPDCAGLGLFRR